MRVHDRREPGGAQVLGVDVIDTTGLAERRLVSVAATQRSCCCSARAAG
ncbi:MAG: hypothetical protein AB1730_16795 [Myxococcota bacterium]